MPFYPCRSWGGKLNYKDISVPTGVDDYTIKATDISSSAKIVARFTARDLTEKEILEQRVSDLEDAMADLIA